MFGLKALAVALLLSGGPAVVPDAPGSPLVSAERSSIDEWIEELGGELAGRKASMAALIEMGETVVPSLLPLLEHHRWTVRWDAVSVLGALEDERALPGLIERVLADADNHVRWRALWAVRVTARRTEAATEAFAIALRDETEPSRRWNAAIGLTMFGDARALPALHAGLAHESGWVRWEAVNALGRVRGEGSAALVGRCLREDSDDTVRREAAFVLGKLCGPEGREALIGALGDSSSAVRWRAAQALARCRAGLARAALEARLGVETERLVREHLEAAIAALAADNRRAGG